MSKSIQVLLVLPAYRAAGELLLRALSEQASLPKFTASKRLLTSQIGEAILFSALAKHSAIMPAYAALSALGAGFEGSTGYWLRIDPVELMVDAGNICLVGRDHLLLQNKEAQQLLASLNDLLSQDNLEIQAGSAQEWYLQLPSYLDLHTFLLSDVIGRDIRPFLPSGQAGKEWNRRITELQMLLFAHDVNMQRQNMHKPLINSVWIWGEAQLTHPYSLQAYRHIWSDETLIKGMVMHSGQEQAIAASSQFSLDSLNAAGDYLITLNHHQLASTYLHTITSLLQAVRQRQIQRFTIYLGNGCTYQWQAPRRFFGYEFRV